MKKIITIVLATLMLASLPVFSSANAKGDVDNNGKVEAADARLALRCAVSLEQYNEDSAEFKACDADNNGKIEAADARIILRVAVGLENFPAEEPDEKTDLDVLESDEYVIKGKMTDGDRTVSAVLLVRKGDKLYMSTKIDSMEIGILVLDNVAYLVTPDRNYSLELNETARKAMGLDDETYKSMTDIASFKISTPDIDEATGVTETEKGTTYSYNYEDGAVNEMTLNEGRLVSIASRDKDGKITSETDFEYILAEADDSYFALPSNPLNRYPNLLSPGSAGVAAFMLQIIKDVL